MRTLCQLHTRDDPMDATRDDDRADDDDDRCATDATFTYHHAMPITRT